MLSHSRRYSREYVIKLPEIIVHELQILVSKQQVLICNSEFVTKNT